MPIHTNKNIIGFYILVVTLSLALYFYDKPAVFISRNYHVSILGANEYAIGLIIPYVIGLAFAVAAYICIHTYIDLLDHSKESAAFNDFKNGQFFLTLNIGITPLLSGIVIRIDNPNSPRSMVGAAVARCVSLVIVIYGASLMYRSSTRLLSFIGYTRKRPFIATIIAFAGTATLFAILGVRFATNSFMFRHSFLNLVYPISYRGPNAASIYAFILPGLAVWFILCLAAQNFLIFQHRTKGKLYKKAFMSIALGLIVSILSIAGLRILQMLPIAYEDTNPMSLLSTAYCIGVIGIVGLWFYVRGVNKLCAIEKV
jgi:hypothetical protein